jgi:hypothetical protein
MMKRTAGPKAKLTSSSSTPRKPVKAASAGAKIKGVAKSAATAKARPKKSKSVKPNANKKMPVAKAGQSSARQQTVGGGDWREQTLARMRSLIFEADPQMIEERKWRKPSNGMVGVPVWSHNGIICTGETYKNVVKLTFAKGASLPDPTRLFNSSLDGNARRAIDIPEGEMVDANAFKALVKAAVSQNGSPAQKARAPMKSDAKAKSSAGNSKPVKLLSGGNPQISKADGDAPVQAYIAAIPGWKQDIGRWLDSVIVRYVPNVRKAVKWNSPLYGIEGQGWFLGIHVYTRFVRVAFFRGASLQPVPPGPSKSKDNRYLDIHEHDPLDEGQLARWLKQAAAIPGWGAT